MKTLRRHKQIINLFLVTLTAFWQIGQPLQGATIFWDGSTSAVWNVAANWNTAIDLTGTDLAVGTGNDLVFLANTSANLTQTLGANTTARSLTFNSNVVSPIAISGNTLTLTPTGVGLTPTGTGIDMTGAGANVSIASTITLGADQTWLLGAGRTLTLTGAFTADATDDLIIDGAGTLNIGNTTDNSYNINSVTLQNGATLVNSADNPFGDTTTTIIMNTGTTWDKGGFGDAFRGLSGTGGSVINAGNLDFRAVTGDTFTFGGTVTGPATADIVKQGQTQFGTQIMTGDVNFADQINVFSGVLSFADANGAANLAVGTILIGRSDNVTVRDATFPLATLRLDSTANNHVAGNRLHNDEPVLMRSTGHLQLIGNATTATTENVGVLTVEESNGVDALARLTLQEGGAGLELTADSLTRSPGGALLVRGPGLGSGALGAGVSRLVFDITAPTITGSLGTPTAGILQGVFTDLSPTGNGTSLATYGADGVRPLSATEYVSSFAGAGQNVELIANQTLGAATTDLTATLGGAGVTLDLGGQALTLSNAAIASNGSAAATISNGTINFGAATEGFILAASNLTLNANITGAAQLTKAGAGTLTISAPQTGTGGMSIVQGTVDVATSFGLPFGRLNVDNATLNLTGSGTNNRVGLLSGSWNSTVNLNTNSLEMVGTADLSYYGQINGAAGSTLIKSGGNVWSQRSLNSSYLGNVIVRGGTFRLVGDGNTTSPTAGTLTGAADWLVETGGTLLLENQNGTDTRSISDRMGNTSSLRLNRGTFAITGNNNARPSETIGAITLEGAYNIITLDADFGGQAAANLANTTHGDVVLTAASLTRNNFATGLVRGDNLGFAIGGIADATAPLAANTTGGFAGDPGGAESNFIITAAPTLSGAGTGAAVGFVPYLTGGVTAASAGDSLITTGPNGLRLLDFSPTTTDYSFLGVAANANLVSATISGKNVYVDITANNSDAILDASATVGGFVLDNTGGTGSDLNLNGNTLTVAGGLLLATGSQDAEVLASGSITFGPNAVTGYEGRIHATRRLDVRAPITDNAGNVVSLTTDGNVYLYNGNTYTGPTRINSGRLETGNANALPITTTVDIDSGAALRLFGGSQEIAGLTGLGFVENDNTAVNPRTLTINNSADFTFDGVLRNTSAAAAGELLLVKKGTGTQTLSGLTGSSATGAVAIEAGKLVLNGGITATSGQTFLDNRLAPAVIVGLGSVGGDSGVLQIGGVSGKLNQTIAGLSTVTGAGTANAVIGGNAQTSLLTINQATDAAFVGNLGGAGTNENNLAITKNGAGILTVTGNATYAGATTVTAGKLTLTGTHDLDGPISVTGGELRVQGAGLLGANSGSTLNVGNGGSLIFNNGNTNQTFSGTGNVLTLNQSTLTTQLGFGVSGANNDRITLGSGQTLSVTGLIDTVIVIGSAPTTFTDRGYLLIDSGVDGAFTGLGSFQIGSIENAGNFIYNVAREITGTDPDRLYLTVTQNTTPPPADAWWKGDLTGPAAGSWTAVQLGGASNWDTSQAGGVDAQVPPGSNSHVHFSATGAGNFATQLLSPLTIKQLTFHTGSGTSGVAIAGTGPLTIGNGTDTPSLEIEAVGNDAISISAPIALGASQTWNIADSTAVLSVSGGISGTGDLTVNGNGTALGTLKLSGVSSAYVGNTIVSAGRLILEGANRLPVGADLTLGGATASAVLQLGTATAAANTTIGNLNDGATSGSSVVGGNAAISTLTLNQTSSFTLNGNIGGAGTNENNVGINKGGVGVITLAGANTYVGATTITAGSIILDSTATFSGSNALIIRPVSGATSAFDVNGRAAVLTGGVTLGGTDGTSIAQIKDTATGGSLTLGGNVLYDSTGNPGAAVISANLINGAAARTFTANDSSNAPIDLTLNGTYTSANSATLDGTGVGEINGAWTLAGTDLAISKNGTGTWNVNAVTNTTGTGDWNINGGIVNATVTNALNAADHIIVTGSGLVDSAIVNISGTAGTSGVHQGNDIFVRAGARVNVSVSNGISTGTRSLIIGDTNSIAAPGRVDLSADINVGANGVLLGATGGHTGQLTGTGTVTTAGGFSLRQGLIESGITLAGASAVTKVGEGPVTFQGSSLSTGTTNIQEGSLILDYTINNTSKIGGTLTLGAATTAFTAPVSLVLNGSAAAATTQSVTSTSLSTSGDIVIDINPGAGQTATLALGAITRATPGVTLAMDLTDAGSAITTTNPASALVPYATVATGGTTRLAAISGGQFTQAITTAQNDVTQWEAGQNVISSGGGFAGTLNAASCNQVASLTFDAAAASAIAIDSASTLNISTGGILVNSTVGANGSVISGGSLRTQSAMGTPSELVIHQNNTAGSLTISSNVLDSAGITKSGNGTLTLSGANTFQPNSRLTINEGTVDLSGGNALGDATIVLMRTGTTLNVNTSETVGSLGNATANSTLGNINIASGQTLTLNQATDFTMNGVFGGAGNLTKNGAGILTVTGNATLTGALILNGGRTVLSGAAGDIAQATSYVLNGSELRSAQDQGANVNRISDSASITLNNTAGTNGLISENVNQSAARNENVGPVNLGFGHNVITVAPTQNNAAAVAQIAADTLTRGANSATLLVRGLNLGNTTAIRKGLIIFDSGGQTALNGFEVGGGGTTASNTSIIPWIVGDIATAGLGNSFVTNVDGTTGLTPLTAAQYVTNEAGFNALTGAATDNVRFDANPAGALAGTATAINSLVLDATAAITLTGPASSLEITSGAILAANTGNHSITGFTGLTTGGSRDYTIFVTTAASTLTVASPLTSAVPLVKSGAGTLALTGTGNAMTAVQVNQGVIQIAANANLGTAPVTLTGGGLRLATGYADDLGALPITVSTGGGFIDTNGVSASATNLAVSGSGTLTKQGAGILTLTGATATTHTGQTIVTGGTVALNKTPGADAIGTGGLLIQGLNNGGTVTLNHLASDQIADTATVVMSNNGGTPTGGAVWNINANSETIGALEMTTVSTSNTKLNIAAGGVLTVNGPITLNHNRAATGNTSAMVEITGAGTLNLGSATRVITVESTNTGVNLPGSDADIDTVITNGGIAKEGSRTLFLKGTNTYAGVTDIREGTISISASANLGDASVTNTLRIANGSILQSTGANVDLGANRAITLEGSGASIDVTGTNVLTAPGIISGDDCTPLSKTGSGTLVLNGANTYAGDTFITLGTLEVLTTTGTGATTVSSGAVLTGTGTVNGLATTTHVIDGALRPGGTLATVAGADVGTLTLIGNTSGDLATFGAASVTTFGFTNRTLNDAANVFSVLANPIANAGILSGWNGATTVGLNDSLNLTQFGGASGSGSALFNTAAKIAVSAVPTSTWVPNFGDIFDFADWVSITGFNTGGASHDGLADNGSTFDLPDISASGFLWDTSLFASHGLVVIVPEPSRLMLLMFGLLGLFFRRRRND